MMGGGVRSRTWRVVAAVVCLCSLVLSLTYFSLFRSVKQDENIRETAPLELMKGNIFFNGKELDFQTGFAVAESGLLASLTQSGRKEVEGDAAEGEWRLLNASLHCGHDEFRFKATGPDAADLKLEMSNSDLLPLTQVPRACGFSVEQTALGLVLRVPFDGCSVKKGNKTYVMALRWRENTVNLTCPVLASPEEMPDATQSLQQPEESASSEPHSRPRRHWKWPMMYSPCSPHRPFPLCWHTTPPPTTTTTTTTAVPTVIPPQLLSKLLDLYPIYEQYLQNHPHVKPYLNVHKHPGFQLFHKMTQSQQQRHRHQHQHPFQYLLKKHFYFTTTEPPTTTVQTTTPCGQTTTTSSPDCPGSQRWLFPFHKHLFSPRVSFNTDQNDLSFPMEGGYDTRDQAIPDSFWESFPLMH